MSDPVKVRLNAESSNGKTTDSESVNAGSNPASASMPKEKARSKEKKEITVIAQNKVSWVGGEETVLSFDTAWHLMLDKAREGYMPVSSHFLGFVRKPD